MRFLKEIIQENIDHRGQIWSLAKSMQWKQYKGTDAGILWGFAKPLMYIVVFYFAITIGFKSSKGIPGIDCVYFVWLAIGMISFFYMKDMITNGAACFRKNAALITRAKYPVGTLPATACVSYMLIHFVMIGLGIIICLIFRCWPSIYWIQLPLYMALMFIMAVFWSIASGIVSVLYRDFYNLLQVLNQAVFWLSAILFDVNGLSPMLQKLFYFNPITYIVEGYRNCFCRQVWFWEEPIKLGCYIIVLIVMMAIALAMYKKFKARIPDLLQ